LKPTVDSVFNSTTSDQFKKLALAVFRYQATENKIYRQYVNSLKINIDSVSNLEQIPFLPIEFFKTHEIITESETKDQQPTIFTSSGTTGLKQSKHIVSDISIYEKSYLKAFKYFYGNIEDYCIIALLPSYLERDGSSLIYMCDDLIKRSKHHESGFYLNNYTELLVKLKQLKNQKTILIGVTYALLDVAEIISLNKNEKSEYNNLIVMETGGMKGKREELLREELHIKLCEHFGVDTIHSEYGMTELLSQAYSKGNGVFNCPPWMKILIRDTNDPFSILSENKTGGINIIDLANINSCSFIASQDLGKLVGNTSFEVLGRFDNSDIRGCNLLIE
jgi:phenylacetate-coenzyme A ligase PaaK-like adenylate-forming protein